MKVRRHGGMGFGLFRRTWHAASGLMRRLGPNEEEGRFGDFTVTPRVVYIAFLAIGIGILSGFVALALLRLIGLFTNLFFYQRWSFALVSPAGNRLGPFVIAVPVVGALIVGMMARYGSERIRGHGIPEALEVILINGSRAQPRVAILKPLSAAISIGSGGPFGAEGPIILTGGAFGSLVAQFIHLTSAERKTLLVAGAAGGMSATFASPVAAVLLGVELLLFEWKPRSLFPVALASLAAFVVRHYIIGPGPLFPVPAHPAFIGINGLLACVMVGLLAGALSILLTVMVYAAEDTFGLLPIHWMWWPAIGGVVVGLGGFFFPRALGVGYDTIGSLLQGDLTVRVILGVLVVKSIIWSVSLGSGTSGGVLAPLLMLGGALGGLEALFLPPEGAGFWPLISMAATLGGTMRVPFTGAIFALELTHDTNALVPLFTAVIIAYGVSTLFMRRSILTEKVSRRGYHLSREYAIDPLEILFVREVMRTNIAVLPSNASLTDLAQSIHSDGVHGQRLYPLVDADGHMTGVVGRRDLQELLTHRQDVADADRQLVDVVHREPTVAYSDEPLRAVVYRMAETGRTRLPVVDRAEPGRLVGLVSLDDLLKARARNLEAEQRRERVLRLRFILPSRMRQRRDELRRRS